MAEYRVNIREILEKEVIIEAGSRTEATQIAANRYRNEDIVLTADDYKETEISSKKIENTKEAENKKYKGI